MHQERFHQSQFLRQGELCLKSGNLFGGLWCLAKATETKLSDVRNGFITDSKNPQRKSNYLLKTNSDRFRTPDALKSESNLKSTHHHELNIINIISRPHTRRQTKSSSLG